MVEVLHLVLYGISDIRFCKIVASKSADGSNLDFIFENLNEIVANLISSNIRRSINKTELRVQIVARQGHLKLCLPLLSKIRSMKLIENKSSNSI